MPTIMTRTTAPVTASGGEPEPRHDRAGTPDTTARPHGHTVVPEAEADLALRLARHNDRLAAAAGRRAPRTVAEMRARLAAQEVAA